MALEIIDIFTARKNDRLDSIAFKYYGSEGHIDSLYEANPELLETGSLLLEAGTKINMPKIDASRRLERSEFNLFGD